LRFQWQRNQADVAGATNATLTLAGFQMADEGNYRVVVVNDYGSVTSAEAHVMAGSVPRLLSPARRVDGSFQLQLVGLANSNYVIQASSNLIDWQTLTTMSSTNGYLDYVDADAVNWNSRYYRAVLAP
jgi:hypothetical protein